MINLTKKQLASVSDSIDLRREISDALLGEKMCIDIGDVGNLIGLTVGEWIKKNKIEGFECSDFESGIKHGFSLTDGTH